MTELWIEWKTKSGFPTRPTAPWKSRQGGEISTFPQLRRFVGRVPKQEDRKLRAVEKMEIQNRDSHFPTAPKACGARKDFLT